MTFMVSENSGSNFTPLDPGSYNAICYLVADVGEQWHDPMQGQKEGRWTHEMMIGWEIVGEAIETENGTIPYTMHKRFTASLNGRAKLRQWLDAWRGKPFNAEDLKGFDLRNILGTGCMLQLGYAKEGSKYFDVLSCMALPKGMKLDKPSRTIAWDIDNPKDMARLEELPKAVRNAIEKSKQVAGEKLTEPANPDPAAVFGDRDELNALFEESDGLAF